MTKRKPIADEAKNQAEEEIAGLMDVRHAPREVHEIAFNKGLIPYIPADRKHGR